MGFGDGLTWAFTKRDFEFLDLPCGNDAPSLPPDLPGHGHRATASAPLPHPLALLYQNPTLPLSEPTLHSPTDVANDHHV